jgi:hypothetical protein
MSPRFGFGSLTWTALTDRRRRATQQIVGRKRRGVFRIMTGAAMVE